MIGKMNDLVLYLIAGAQYFPPSRLILLLPYLFLLSPRELRLPAHLW